MARQRRGRGGGGSKDAVKAAGLVGAHPFLAGRLKMKTKPKAAAQGAASRIEGKVSTRQPPTAAL